MEWNGIKLNEMEGNETKWNEIFQIPLTSRRTTARRSDNKFQIISPPHTRTHHGDSTFYTIEAMRFYPVPTTYRTEFAVEKQFVERSSRIHNPGQRSESYTQYHAPDFLSPR